LLIANGANALVSWGCAAALSPQLAAGDLLLPMQLIGSDGRRYTADSDWRQKLTSCLIEKRPIHTGALLESDRIVTSALDKEKLASAANAIALDMESVAIAQIAEDTRIPFIAVRAVADPVNLDLPECVVHAIGAQGRINLPKLSLHAVRRPITIIDLIRLGGHFRHAVQTLRALSPLAATGFLLDAIEPTVSAGNA
jgi:adenosylhomocysteine nucleosidase